MAFKNGKENFSISVDARVMECLQMVANRKYFGNRSHAAEKALWEFVFSELAETPEARDLIYNTLSNNSS